ncbi:MAG TPA: DNA methyltransferase [Symbiobacteriaceae bacterium]|nr:DNA methyltransferase [Symbiobacteriaceae bacterium]
MAKQQSFDLGPQKSGPVDCLGMTFENDEARRAYFLERLKEKLQDPEFRRLPGFPKGVDEDILRMSDPPYHTACPNPFAGEFISVHGKPYQEDEEYSRSPLAVDVSEGKNDPLYNAHSYHTKVPHKAIMRYVLHYTEPGDIVLDPFCGSGMTGVAAAACGAPDLEFKTELERDTPGVHWGERRAMLGDLSPIAALIAHNYRAGFENADVAQAERVLAEVEATLGDVFSTLHTGWDSSDRQSLNRHNKEPEGTTPRGVINFVLWSDVFICPSCSNEVVFWNAAADPARATVMDSFLCSHCGGTLDKGSMDRATVAVFDPVLNQATTRRKQVPVLINYSYEGRRYEKVPDKHDLEAIQQCDSLANLEVIPSVPYMLKGEEWGDTWRAGYHYGYTHAHHFYTRRNLAALSHIWKVAREGKSRFLQFLFTSTHAWTTRLNRLLVSNYFAKRGGVIGQTLSGTMYVPSLAVETNALERFRLRLSSISTIASRNGLVTTQSATSLRQLGADSIDYIFTDPPFGDNLYYSELNFLLEAWMGVYTTNNPEAVVSPSQGKGLEAYLNLMADSFSEMYRVLKPGRWLTVVFHNSKNAVWNAIQEAIGRAGFVVADVRILEKTHKTYKQLNSTNAVKQDLVISAYKPKGDYGVSFMLQSGGAEGVWAFVAEHLHQLPVFVSENGEAVPIPERMNYLLFDRMIAYYVQRGISVPISAPEFYQGLRQRFAEREAMYFLPNQVIEYDRERAKVAKVRQLTLVVTDESSAILWVRQQLLDKPQSFQDLQPVFMREIQAWTKYERTIELMEILEENFLLFDGIGPVPAQIHTYLSTNFKDMRGLSKDDPTLKAKAVDRWYVPDPNKQADLDQLRTKRLLKEFAEYKESKQKKLKLFRTEAIRAGFKAAYDQKDYRTIVDVAKKLPEQVIQEDEKLLMYYDVASMRLGED